MCIAAWIAVRRGMHGRIPAVAARLTARAQPDRTVRPTTRCLLDVACFVSTCFINAAAHADSPLEPEAATGFRARAAVHAEHAMVATAHPLATEAALRILREGGNATDAAVAAALVLGLVEPQSSGLGGGGFLLQYQAAGKEVSAWDGRETAPQIAGPDWFLAEDGEPMGFWNALASGRAVGVPGLARMLEAVHRAQGRLPWARLMQPAIALAENGFPVSPRLNRLLAAEGPRLADAAARSLYLDAEGKPWPVGHRLRNPAYASTLRALAREGADVLHGGARAKAIVARVRAAAGSELLSESDLARYAAKPRTPLCGDYRGYRICGMSPPSSGASTTLAMLGILSHGELAAMRPDSVAAIHAFSEAGRLAYADRERYLADSDFVPVPLAGLLAPDYLAARAQLIRPEQSLRWASPGQPQGVAALAAPQGPEEAGTTHLSVVDAQGNAVALTASIESAFGSRIWVEGFFLNNQLTDFSFMPERNGLPVANRVEGGKRPLSSMSPTFVFDPEGGLVAVLGSAGGSAIINHVARTLVALIDWKMPPDAALALGLYGSRNGPTELESDTAVVRQADALRLLGHEIRLRDDPSGLHLVLRDPDGGWWGAADPRRDGEAAGY